MAEDWYVKASFTTGELGRLLNLSSQAIRNYCNRKDTSKRPEFSKTPDGTIKFARGDIEQWLRETRRPNLGQLILKLRTGIGGQG